ncbi:hypothetical protein ANAPH1_00375 [Anaplasma phagocytophilum]|nr:hypothetical protein ANAPH1_00375 [Anaplasma phagocytophilum]
MLGKIIKTLYGPAQHGKSLIVVGFMSDAAIILPSYLLGTDKVKDGVVCDMPINNAHKVTT